MWVAVPSSCVYIGSGFFPTSTTWEAQHLPDTILSIMASPRMARLWVRAGTEMAFHVPWGPSARAWPVPWHKNPIVFSPEDQESA